ncbi:cysteine hydrolase family protein [Polyangium spumosum]|uniref:Isochorismatase family protein n=1 Tax=Polyangium spumosum TaxID=889282 RepID=A0A6N7PZN8_9BACT|nr:cysteine hydrolase family protein [Polyangium spumosum]MRG95755.1 isochorismatase family protein [Polyangium spumosum]
MAEPTTLRALVGLPADPTALRDSALVMIDCQNTYRRGVMQLEGVEAALDQAARLLARARVVGAPVIHIAHDAGPGSPYDVNAEIGHIADVVAPRAGEPLIVKRFPSSFEQTDLAERLEKLGAKNLILAGFMTHVCVNSTARAAFNRGYRATVVGGATATRALPGPSGRVLPAATVHEVALAALSDIFAVVVGDESDIPD